MTELSGREDLAVDDPLALERQVCFALAVASRGVVGVYRPLLEPLGLTHPQYLVMLALWGQTPLSVTEIATMLQLDLATLSPLLKRLESTGYLTRRRSSRDERLLEINLTDAGRQLRTKALAVPGAVMKNLDINETDVRSLHAVLTPLIAQTQQARARST